jgi:hypothetical protein
MTFSIDHVVIASDDLDAAVVNARTAGFTVAAGGVHGSGNTHNALIGFGDGAYLELFAPTTKGRHAQHRWFARIRNGGGLVDFCLLGAGLASETARIRQRGIDYSQPFAMTRVTPDGTRIEWLLSTPPGATGENGWPFLIEDTTPRAMRVPQAPGEIRHANGAQGVAGITVLVRDADAASKAYATILGGGPATPSRPADARLFALSGAWIALREPRSAEETQHLERHGQGPYRLTLRSTGAPVAAEAGSLLDPALFCGAQIAVA